MGACLKNLLPENLQIAIGIENLKITPCRVVNDLGNTIGLLILGAIAIDSMYIQTPDVLLSTIL